MNFDLKRPCKDCPFRTDVKPYLTASRAREITDAITRQQATFSCHKTNQLVDGDDGENEVLETGKSQHCAGALIMLERLERPNQMMRIAERLGMYDASKLDMDAPVFDSPRAMVAAQRVKA